MTRRRPRVAVLGGGIQGTTVALELDRRGCRVDLFDAADLLVGGASLHNEGKIHLGHTYAAGSPATVHAMIAGALAFRSNLERWVEPGTVTAARSDPVVYAVHRTSLLDAAALADHYRAVDDAVAAALAAGGDYLGEASLPRTRPADPDTMGAFDPDEVVAAFVTAERSIDPAPIAAALRAAVAASGIRVHLATRVVAVRPGTPCIVVMTDGDAGTYDQVVNALWSDRLRIDGTAGIRPPRPWLFRCKYGVRIYGRPPATPTATVALGPFGDVVRQPDHVYLSWYPAGRVATSSDIAPPPWPVIATGDVAAAVARATIAGLSRVMPALVDLDPTRAVVSGGPIFAWADSDLDDPATRLHERHEIGPTSHGAFHTIDTGKYTSAPRFALAVADRVAPR